MEKNKENKDKMKLNDELLDTISGGGSWGLSDVLRCSNCGYGGDNPMYSAGQECPSCHKGVLY